MDYPVQPPEGVTPNVIKPESIAYQVYITAGVCLTLIVVFSLTRLLSKIYFGPRTIKIDESEEAPTSRPDFTQLTLRPRSRIRCGIGMMPASSVSCAASHNETLTWAVPLLHVLFHDDSLCEPSGS